MYKFYAALLGLIFVLTTLATAAPAQTLDFRFGGGGLQRYLYGPEYGNPDIRYYQFRSFYRDPYLWNPWEHDRWYGRYWDGYRWVEGWWGGPRSYGNYDSVCAHCGYNRCRCDQRSDRERDGWRYDRRDRDDNDRNDRRSRRSRR